MVKDAAGCGAGPAVRPGEQRSRSGRGRLAVRKRRHVRVTATGGRGGRDGGRGRGRVAGEKLVGQENHRAYASIRGYGVHRDLEPVAGGQHAGDGESELWGNAQAGDADRGPGREESRGAVLLLLAHAEARVVDDEADALRDGLDVDLHRSAGGGVVGGVGEQLGEDHRDGFHGLADDGEVDLSVDPDPVELPDAALGAAGDVEDGRDGLPASEPAAAQHRDALRPAAELAVGVVDGHQVGEHVGVVAVFLLGVLYDHLLLVREPLKSTHGRLEDGLGLLFGVLADLGHFSGLPVQQTGVGDVDLVPLPLQRVPLLP